MILTCLPGSSCILMPNLHQYYCCQTANQLCFACIVIIKVIKNGSRCLRDSFARRVKSFPTDFEGTKESRQVYLSESRNGGSGCQGVSEQHQATRRCGGVAWRAMCSPFPPQGLQ